MLDHNANNTSKITLESKVYIWSLIAEPLHFFLLSDPISTGFAITLSRVLQMVFCLFIVARMFTRGFKIALPNPTYFLYYFFTLYFVLVVLSSILGILFYESYVLKQAYDIEYASSEFSAIIRGPYTRPFFEVIIPLYYFGYFVIMPKYILKSRLEIVYLLRWLSRIFYFVLLIGFLDVFSGILLGVELIPRHLVDSRWVEVGGRFHGIAGEPRDAVLYLVFSLAVIYLKSALLGEGKVSRMLPLIVLFALSLTQSGSGIFGVAMGIILILLFYGGFSLKKLSVCLFSVIGFIIVASYLISEIVRLRVYYDAFSDLYYLLSTGTELPFVLMVQSVDFIPFWAILENIKEFNLLPVFFGSGAGTASIINNNMTGWGELANPHAQVSRIVYETGIVGLSLYVMIFISPVKKLISRLPKARQAAVFINFLILLGVSLGHRSTIIFIYLGIVIAILVNWFDISRHPDRRPVAGGEVNQSVVP